MIEGFFLILLYLTICFMKKIFFFVSFFLFLIILTSCFKVKEQVSGSKPISHSLFDSLLQRYVDNDGYVDYRGFRKDSVEFKKYLTLLSNNYPSEKNWSREAQMAYWINAYNAFTIKLICDHYPVTSIKDIKRGIPFVSDTWQINFITIENKTYNLNNIEHGILRPKYNDPRIHAAVNCASKSCPKLSHHAYTAENLNVQLDEAMRSFINDPTHNKIISENKAEMSKIFDWFAGDFKKTSPTVISFINTYSSKIKLKGNATLSFLDYDWALNEQVYAR